MSVVGIVIPFVQLALAASESAGVVNPLDFLLCDSVVVESKLDASMGQERRIIG